MSISTPPIARRKKVLGALVESTSGTLNDPSAALTMSIYDAKMGPDGMYPDVRQAQGNYFGSTDRVKGIQKGKCTFRWEAAAADAIMVLLQGCGFTVNTGATVATPTSNIASMSTLSLKLWEDGREKTMIGCSGTITLEGAAGGRVFGSGDFDGLWNGVTDEAMPALAPITTAPYRAAAATLTVGGAAIPLVSSFNLNLQNQVEAREAVTLAKGALAYIVTDRNPTIELDPEARLVADHDAYGLFLAGTAAALVLTLSDGSNTLTINGARLQRIDISDEDRDGKLADPITCELHESSGNDSVTFTKA